MSANIVERSDIYMKNNLLSIFVKVAFFVAIYFGWMYGWEFGNEKSGMVLGAVLGFVGAVIAPAVVALLHMFVGSLFGTKQNE